jgi:hypothetical protein
MPDAVQDVAFVLDHCSVDCPNAGKLIAGLAEIVTVGAAGELTITVTDWDAEPPAPLQVIVYVRFAVSAPVLAEPAVA